MHRARAFLHPPVPVLLGLLAAWTLIAPSRAPGRPWPMALTALAAAALFALPQMLPSRSRALLPAAIVVGVAIAAFWDLESTFNRRALEGLLTYVNARGQLFALTALAALMLRAMLRDPRARALALVAAGLSAIMPIALRSYAATGLMLLFGGLALLPLGARGRRRAIAGMLAALVLTLGTTTILGAFFPASSDAIPTDLGNHRISLWHDAVTLTSKEPLGGIGPGRFTQESGVARRDKETRTTHHGFLQVAAETGIVGGLFLVAAFAAALWSAARVPSPTAATMLGMAAVTIFGIQVAIDHVLHVPWLVATTAGIAGAALLDDPGNERARPRGRARRG